MTSPVSSLLPLIRAEFGKLRIPTSSDKVYKDECMVSFDSPYTPGGLYVNLATLQGFGPDYVRNDITRNAGRLYVHFQYTETAKEGTIGDETTEPPPATPTKLAINMEGGFESGAARYEVTKQHSLAVWTGSALEEIPFPNNELPEFVSNVCTAIIDHNGMRLRVQAEAWDGDKDRIESKYAAALAQLDNGKKISNDPNSWRCEASGETENLWLNLSTGHIGGGRRQWDGSGGSGAALQHYLDTGKQYPLCVKLGTITPSGADVWSYADDEDTLVLDSKLAEHLRHWGIDIMSLEKTEKSVIEMEAELNASYDWTRILDGGGEAVKLSGPGYVGLRNIGSSCYMNSVLQAMLNVPEIRVKYTESFSNLLATCPADPSTDLSIQISKIGRALFSDRYCPHHDSSEDDMQKYAVAPYMFKYLVGKNHREFSSGRQQDAAEYFQFLLDVVARSERTNAYRLLAPDATSELFEFEFEKRFQCQVTGQVKYVSGRETLNNMLEVRIPMEAAIPRMSTEEHDVKRLKVEGDDTKSAEELEVPFSACLDASFASEVVEITNNAVLENGGRVAALMSTKVKYFPKYLVIKLNRYYVDADWKLKKISAAVKMPESLNLTEWTSAGLQPGETLIPEGASGPVEVDVEAARAVEDALTMQLVSMGFGENGSRRAARNTATSGGDVEVAMNWVLEHMGDPDFDAPIEPLGKASAGTTPVPAGDSFDPAAVEMLMSFGGFSETRVKKALRETGGDSERAADWLFSHVGEDETEDTPHAVSSAVTPARGDGRYKLIAVVSHMGRNTEHGHYVCHVLRDGKWVLFNDDKGYFQCFDRRRPVYQLNGAAPNHNWAKDTDLAGILTLLGGVQQAIKEGHASTAGPSAGGMPPMAVAAPMDIEAPKIAKDMDRA